MTRSDAGHRDALTELRARLDHGICQGARDSRPADWPQRDECSLARWPLASYAQALSVIREDPQEWAAQVQAAIRDTESVLKDNRPLLAAILLAPAKLLTRVQEAVPGDPVGAWIALCWTVTAAAQIIESGLPVPEYGSGDAELLSPLAARLQFLAFTEPLRWRGQADRAWWFGPADEEFGGDELLRRACGDQPWHHLVGQASAARRTWLTYLNEYQSHLFLAPGLLT